MREFEVRPYRDEPCFSPSLPDAVQQPLRGIARDVRLTPVLEQRLFEVAGGLSNHQIADAHNITVNTVKTEIRLLLSLLGGLGCRHQIADAVKAACLRAEAGATAEEVRAFLRLRFE
jgi:DNA-binding CsgD family transcriptional regulator